jgi:hypothetical protein
MPLKYDLSGAGRRKCPDWNTCGYSFDVVLTTFARGFVIMAFSATLACEPFQAIDVSRDATWLEYWVGEKSVDDINCKQQT